MTKMTCTRSAGSRRRPVGDPASGTSILQAHIGDEPVSWVIERISWCLEPANPAPADRHPARVPGVGDPWWLRNPNLTLTEPWQPLFRVEWASAMIACTTWWSSRWWMPIPWKRWKTRRPKRRSGAARLHHVWPGAAPRPADRASRGRGPPHRPRLRRADLRFRPLLPTVECAGRGATTSTFTDQAC